MGRGGGTGAQKLGNSVGTRTTESCLVRGGAQRRHSCCQSQPPKQDQRWRKTYFPLPSIFHQCFPLAKPNIEQREGRARDKI